MFEVPASLLAWFYSWTNSYVAAIALIAVVVMLIVTPLTLKSTRGMLEMQRLAPEIRKLQNELRGDRQRLNEEMMRLYQDHKVNPMASCLPLLAQTPVFIIMFRIMIGLTYRPEGGNEAVATTVLRAGGASNPTEVGFIPRYISTDSVMFQDLARQTEMTSLGLDLSLSPLQALGTNFVQGLLYAAIVVVLGGLYFFQQRMVAARATISPTMSPTQQKLMQYLPVFFAVFQVFFLLGLVIYYIVQAILRILQQGYITKRFYGSDESLGRQAQRAGEQARELAKDAGEDTGLFAQAKRDLLGGRDASTDTPTKSPKGAAGKNGGADASSRSKQTPAKQSPKKQPAKKSSAKKQTAKKQTTAPKGRPTPTRRSVPGRPSGGPGRSS
jgi:YidC/Oxa1 family membrane protein insertase